MQLFHKRLEQEDSYRGDFLHACVCSSTGSLGTVRPGQAQRPRPLPEGCHGDRELGDGDGAALSDGRGGPAPD